MYSILPSICTTRSYTLGKMANTAQVKRRCRIHSLLPPSYTSFVQPLSLLRCMQIARLHLAATVFDLFQHAGKN